MAGDEALRLEVGSVFACDWCGRVFVWEERVYVGAEEYIYAGEGDEFVCEACAMAADSGRREQLWFRFEVRQLLLLAEWRAHGGKGSLN